jgi:hypothetical protein
MVISGGGSSMVDAFRPVRRHLSGNASVDVLRPTRRNADTLSGPAPDVTSGGPVAVRAGARPYHCRGIA